VLPVSLASQDLGAGLRQLIRWDDDILIAFWSVPINIHECSLHVYSDHKVSQTQAVEVALGTATKCER